MLSTARASEREVLKIDGMVTTTMKDDKPNTTFKGNCTIVADDGTFGIEG